MRRTAKRQVTHTVGTHTYSGATITQAKEQAEEHLAWLMNSDGFTPRTLSWRGCILLMFRGTYNWEYRIMCLGENELTEGVPSSVWGNGGEKEKEETWHKCLRHLAQQGWDYADGAEDSAVPSFITSEEDRRELCSYFAWQLRYKGFQAQGYSSQECHAMASGWTLDSNGRTVPQTAQVAA